MSKFDVEWAVGVLNKHKHDDRVWRLSWTETALLTPFGIRRTGENKTWHAESVANEHSEVWVLEEFEAVAVAEKLERQASGDDNRDMPATRHLMAMLADLRGDDLDDNDSLVQFAQSEAVAEALEEWEDKP